MPTKLVVQFWIKLILLSIYLVSVANGDTRPRVVSTIKPIQLLVAAIAEDHVESLLLLPANSSPHIYHMRPSDQIRMQSADLILWIGPELERFLVKPLSLLPANNVLALGSNIGNYEMTPTEIEHNHKGVDPHIWLNPVLAVQMSKMIADRLSSADPGNQEKYQQNWLLFKKDAERVDQGIKEALSLISDNYYVVLHDAYGHFENHYGLSRGIAVTTSPEQKLGVKQMLSLRKDIQENDIRCVFREPQFELAVEKMFLEGKSTNFGLLDPLASNTGLSKSAYIEFISDFSEEFIRCLSLSREK